MSKCLSQLFEDQRKAIVLLYVWLAVVFGLFAGTGIFTSEFMRVGPNATAKFMSVRLDTWPKWAMIAVFSFFNTLVNVFVAETMRPWLNNTVQDHKNQYLPYTKATCMLIAQGYWFYGNVVSVFSMFLIFVQVDLLLLRIVADVLVTYYTTRHFVAGKTYNPEAYYAFNTNQGNPAETELASKA